jgi:hypothetical protein
LRLLSAGNISRIPGIAMKGISAVATMIGAAANPHIAKRKEPILYVAILLLIDPESQFG